MKRKLAPLIALACCVGMANAATVIGDGDSNPFATGGGPDGWSGVSILNTAVIDSSTDPGAGPDVFVATEVSMLAGAGRAGGTNHLQAVLVDSADQIVWISPELTPTVEGVNTFPISGAPTIDATAGALRLGVWQWNDGVDDSNGGTVGFAGGGGGGMFQQNLDGSLGAGAISIGHTVAGGHASGPGGRDYHIDMTVSRIPEPSIFPLIALSGLGLLLRRRRS